jgi:hypothetical protein
MLIHGFIGASRVNVWLESNLCRIGTIPLPVRGAVSA